MGKFLTFKNNSTGKVVNLPAHYARMFPDTLVEVDPSDLRCVDCGVPEPEEVTAEPAPEPESQEVFLEEPVPVSDIHRNYSAE